MANAGIMVIVGTVDVPSVPGLPCGSVLLGSFKSYSSSSSSSPSERGSEQGAEGMETHGTPARDPPVPEEPQDPKMALAISSSSPDEAVAGMAISPIQDHYIQGSPGVLEKDGPKSLPQSRGN